MHTPLIKVVHNWRNKQNKSGLYGIHLRITIDRKQKYLPIEVPLKVANDEWMGDDNAWIKASHVFGFEINNKIREKKNIVFNLIAQYHYGQKAVTFQDIFTECKKHQNNDSFNSYFAEYIVKNTSNKKYKVDTLKKYKACLQYLTNFNADIRFRDLTDSLVEDFYEYCKCNKLMGSTISSYFDALKKVIGTARREQLISRSSQNSLFEDLRIKVNKTKRIYLTIEEIKKWKNLSFNKNEMHLERDRDIFLFQVYTGLYYKDLVHLKKEYLIQNEECGPLLVGFRTKNDEQNIIPIFRFPGAINLINKYGSIDQSDQHIFPRNIFIEEPAYNRNLKEIALKAEVNKKISNRSARHSNAHLWIRLGVAKPIVSKMLGHAYEKSTDRYFKVSTIDIIEGTKHINIEDLQI